MIFKGRPLTFWSSPSVKAPSSKPRPYYLQDDFLRKDRLSVVRTSVRERWSLTEKFSHTNKGFEMKEIGGSELSLSYEQNEHDESLSDRENTMISSNEHETNINQYNVSTDKATNNMEEHHYIVSTDKDTDNVDEHHYNEIVPEPVNEKKTNKTVGYEVNDQTSDTPSTRSIEDSGSGDNHVKFRDEDDSDTVRRRNPVTKKNSKVWKREFEKQPQWQNFVLEFSKRLSEADKTDKDANPMKGKNILRPSSRPVSMQIPKTPNPEEEIQEQKSVDRQQEQKREMVVNSEHKRPEMQIEQGNEVPPVYDEAVKGDTVVAVESMERHNENTQVSNHSTTVGGTYHISN